MITSNLINLLALLEGFRSKPYLDSTGTPTIGFGNTFYLDGRKVTMSDKPISKEVAKDMLNRTLASFQTSVKQLVKSKISQNQLEALTSLTYNIGVENLKKSNLLKVVNSEPNNYDKIEVEFMKWIYSKGKMLDGLKKRRIVEFELYKKKTFKLLDMQKIKAFFQGNKWAKFVAIAVGVVVVFFIGKKLLKR